MGHRRPPPAPLSLVRFARALGVLTVVSLVLGQLLSVGHHVLVAHYVCSEHGTLHHGSAQSALRAPTVSDTSVGAGVDREHGAHDECSFPAREREAALAGPAASALAALGERGSERGVISAAEGKSALTVLSRAPKNSPPTTS